MNIDNEYLSRYKKEFEDTHHLMTVTNHEMHNADTEYWDMLLGPIKFNSDNWKGKKAFEYLLNLKYFNNPTNNIEYIKELPTNPDIPEDDKAIQSKTQSLELSSSNNINNETNFNDLFINSEQKSQNIQNNKLAILMKIKKNR
jgi:hypothetical protein